MAIDVATCQINGKGFRTRSEAFAFLGPAKQWPGSNGSGVLAYPHKGLQLDFEYDQFTGVTVTLQPIEYHADRAAFAGTFTRAGAPLDLRGGMNEAQVTQLLGKPTSRDADEEDVVLKYVFGNVVIEFELLDTRGLYVMDLYCEGAVHPV